MTPLQHFLVALLPVSVAVAIRHRKPPSRATVGTVFFGSQFPDLIDKPLAHQFGLLPSGRVFMHSLPVVFPLWCGIAIVTWRLDRQWVGATFIFAHSSHLLADNHSALFPPDPQIPSDLLWPLVAPIPRPIVPHWAGVGGRNVTMWSVFSVVVLTVAAVHLIRSLK